MVVVRMAKIKIFAFILFCLLPLIFLKIFFSWDINFYLMIWSFGDFLIKKIKKF
jgi:hypothetical protein